MPRFTAAYSGFTQRVPEIWALYKLALKASVIHAHTNKNKVSALCRGAVVLLCSHIEGYIEGLGVLALDRIVLKEVKKSSLGGSFPYYFSKDIIDEIRDTGHPQRISNKLRALMDRDSDIWSSAPVFLQTLPSDRFIHGFASPTTKEIKKLFRRFGYTKYLNELGGLLKQVYLPCINMVDQVVDQRNKIAHGDFIVTTTPSDLKSMVDLVHIFCRGTDQVVAAWFTSKGCPIR